MRRKRSWVALGGLFAVLGLAAGLLPSTQGRAEKAATQDQPKEKKGEADHKDSYRYYGPGGLADYWHDKKNPDAAAQRLGRDTWIHWTWGNQKFLRRVSVIAGNLPVPVSVDFFRALDSRNRRTRFRDLGFINEPNCGRKDKDGPDHDETILKEYGLYIDRWNGDPYKYYPGDAYKGTYGSTYPGTKTKEDTRHYGRPTGVVGLRLFDNPAFDAEAKKRWNVNEYFKNPGKMEPPFLVGFSCAFCHIAFDPTKPPKDPENPRWDNLAANIGNQYFREGDLFLGKGRAIFGDKNPDPDAPDDPYRTRGLDEGDFLYHYAVTQQSGTSETSRISYDFINNPNTMNPLMSLKLRLPLAGNETTPAGKKARLGLNILKDGADSIGFRWALMRVPINIGCEGEYWLDRLFNPLTGKRQRPFRIGEVLAGLPEAERKKIEDELGPVFKGMTKERIAELRHKHHSPWGRERFGEDWEEGWRRMEGLEKYLLSYEGFPLRDAADAKKIKGALPDEKEVEQGRQVFLQECARCHSSTLPGKKGDELEKAKKAFPKGDFLADDKRYPVSELGTNMGRSLATNAIDSDIWAEFSSREYKALEPLGRMKFQVPVFPPDAKLPWSVKKPIEVEFEPPGGGRGYYRTPSLIGMWATAPYLHHNALGDYYVVTDDGKKDFFPNDGRRIGRRNRDGTWVDYRIDVSVEGRLKMFEDGMDKMLNPNRRRNWVKRTSADSTLIPDIENAIPRLILALAREVIEKELRAYLKAQKVGNVLEDEAAAAAERVFDRLAAGVLADAKVSLRFGWAVVHLKLREHADRLFDLAFEEMKDWLKEKLPKVPAARLKPKLRDGLLAKLDRFDKELREGALLKIPAGTPVNLYANLNLAALPYAVLAHVRHKDDPRALATALLELSDCPDLVEDRGHTYGSTLRPEQKRALIAFLKTL